MMSCMVCGLFFNKAIAKFFKSFVGHLLRGGRGQCKDKALEAGPLDTTLLRVGKYGASFLHCYNLPQDVCLD